MKQTTDGEIIEEIDMLDVIGGDLSQDEINQLLTAINSEEIATLCKKEDGWQMIIEVHSMDQGVLYDKNNPAHAHVRDINGELLGKFVITKEKPHSIEYVFDFDSNHIIPIEFKKKIVDWAAKPSLNYDKEDGSVTNWGAVKAEWANLHS